MSQQVPYTEEGEMSAIGALLSNPEVYYLVQDHIAPEMFFFPRHQQVWQAVQSIVEQGGQPELMSVHDQLKLTGTLESIGGMGYLMQLVHKTPSTTDALTYFRLVFMAYMRREMLRVAEQIRGMVLSGEMSLKEVTTEAETLLFKVTHRLIEEKPNTLTQALSDLYDDLEERSKAGNTFHIPTGFKAIDTALGGLARGELHMLGGRPGMGKSSLCANIAMNASRLGCRVLYISTEMEAKRLAMRIAAMETGVDLGKLRRGEMGATEWERFIEALIRSEKHLLHLEHVSGATPTDIKARVARMYHRQGIDLLIIDGLWQMTASAYPKDRPLQLGYISQRIIEIAKEFNIAVILAHQLNRNPEQRQDHRPIMSDLEYSGSLEQNADVIMFLYRDEVYNPATEAPGQTEIIVAKNRDGVSGTVNLYFEKSTTRFYDMQSRTIDLTGHAPAAPTHTSKSEPV